MAAHHSTNRLPSIMRGAGVIAAVSAALMLGACAQTGDGLSTAALTDGSAKPAEGTAPEASKNDLEKATEYWGKEFAKNSRDLKTGLAYARNLKAMGRKQEAFSVLQQLAIFHGQNRELASEYGRLALDLGQVQVAQNVLPMADDAANPDWRVLSARGTVFAKQGKFSDAIPFYERALRVSPNQRSVMNNLALAYTMNGEAAKAEGILRQADPDGKDPRIKQNLALVLSLQGRHDEARELAAALPTRGANTAADVDTLSHIVRAQPVSAGGLRGPAADVASGGGWRTVIAENN